MGTTSRTTRTLLPVLAAGLLLSAVPAAQATSVPTNDKFGSAKELTGIIGALSTSNVWAGAEPGEPAIAGHAATNSLWYSWTATKSGRAIFRTRGSAIDTLLAAYTGSAVGSLKQVAANDDSAFSGTTSFQSQIAF